MAIFNKQKWNCIQKKDEQKGKCYVYVNFNLSEILSLLLLDDISFYPRFFISSVPLKSVNPILFSKNPFFIVLLYFIYPFLQLCLPLCLMLVQRRHSGLKYSGLFSIVSNMIVCCCFKWFVVLRFVPPNIFCFFFYKFNHLSSSKNLDQ